MPGKIKVKILAGRNLPVMDRSGDTTDAYVEIKFGNTTYKTDVCRKSLNPQWNSEWYRFEVDDAELQDEPLQVRLMDHDTYSANDAIGKVYVNLNPLLLPGSPLAVKNIWTLEATMNSSSGSQGGSVMTGWIPVFDTMHGIRGEVNIIVKVELFSDCNKFRQSSCGVQFFYSPNIPHGYHAQVIHGFVEELVVSDDPEYKWIDKIRTPRASNEARQTLFFKLSGEVQRKIGLKALDLGGNAVVGYVQNFDLEGESGIVARGIGTAVTLVKLQDITSILPLESSNIEDLTSFGLQSKNPFDFSESDDSLPLIANSPCQSPVPRSPINIRPTTIGRKFPKYEKSSKRQTQRQSSTRVAEYRATCMRSRQFSLQNSNAINIQPSMRKIIGSSLSLTDDIICESSLRNMLALEDMRGEPAGNPFSRGLKNFRYLHQNILPKRVAQIKSKITDSLDDESDQDSNYSSTWSLAGSESNRSSIVDLRNSIRRKKFTHKKVANNDGITALLIRSVHSGFPLDSVIEDRETPAPSPVNFHVDTTIYSDVQEIANNDNIVFSDTNVETSKSLVDDNFLKNNILHDKSTIESKYTIDTNIPMISSSETDTSTSDDDEPSESSTNYNILDETYSLIVPNSPDDKKYIGKFENSRKIVKNREIVASSSLKIMKKSLNINDTDDCKIIRDNDETSCFTSQRERSLESSTDYNILDDSSSLLETNFPNDAKIASVSGKNCDTIDISEITGVDAFESSVRREKIGKTMIEANLAISEENIFSEISLNDCHSECNMILNFPDDKQSLIDPNLSNDENFPIIPQRDIEDSRFLQISPLSDLILSSYMEDDQRILESKRDIDVESCSPIVCTFDEKFTPTSQQSIELPKFSENIASILSINSEKNDKSLDNILNTKEFHCMENIMVSGSNKNFDSSTDYNVLDDSCSVLESSTFSEENINPIFQENLDIRNFPETVVIQDPLSSSSVISKIVQSSMIIENIEENLSKESFSFDSQADENLNSSTDYNVLDDTNSLNEANVFDEARFNEIFQNTMETTNLPEITANKLDLSLPLKQIDKISDNIEDFVDSRSENFIAPFSTAAPIYNSNDENSMSDTKRESSSAVSQSPPIVKLKHLKFLPKQEHFDNPEDIDFVTSTPVEADVTPPDFSPIEKSPESFDTKKWDFPSISTFAKMQSNVSKIERTSVEIATEISSVSDENLENKEKQICPLGVPFERITIARDFKTADDLKISEDLKVANDSKIAKDSNIIDYSEIKNDTRSHDDSKIIDTLIYEKFQDPEDFTRLPNEAIISVEVPSTPRASITKKMPKKVERTDTVIYKGPARDREKLIARASNHETNVKTIVKKSQTTRPNSPIPIIVAPPPEEHATRLQVPVIQTTNINVQSTFSPDEMKTQHFGSIGSRKFPLDETAISEKFNRKYRQHCMLDLIKIIDTRMMIHHGHHERRDSTRSKQRKKRERMNASATPSPDSIHRTRQHRRRSRSRSPDRQHIHARGQVSTLTTHSFPMKNSSVTNLIHDSPLWDSSCENITRNDTSVANIVGTKDTCMNEKENIILTDENYVLSHEVETTSDVTNNFSPTDCSVTSNNVSSNDEKTIVAPVVGSSTKLFVTKDLDSTVFKSHSAGSLERFAERTSDVTKITNNSNTTDDLCVPCSQLTHRQQDEQQPSSPLPASSCLPTSSLATKVTPGSTSTNKNNAAIPNMNRRSSDSDLSITPKGNSLAGSDRSMGGQLRPSTAIVRTMNQDTMEMLEYPFITMQQYPSGFVLNIGGLVSARSVKLLERITNLEEPEGRDAWWTEIRMEVRSHARALACNVVLGYKEEISICDDVCVLNASGTAAVINLLNANSQDQENVLLSRTIMTTSVESERDKIQVKSSSNVKTEKSDETILPGQQQTHVSGRLKRTSECNDHEAPYLPTLSACSLCHLPYSEASVPFRVDVSKCSICRRAKVPDVLFTTIELPENIPMTGRGVFLQATVCKCKRDLRGELNAKEISDCLPFLEYELHSLLLNKLKVKGMNAIFGLKVQVSVGERLVIGMAVGTAVYLTALPAPTVPKIASGNSWHNEEQLAEIQKTLIETVKKNREFYRLKPLVDIENGRSITTSDTDESDDDLPDLDLGIGTKDACVLEVDDVEDMDRINLLMDEKPPEDFHVVNTQSIPGLEDLEIVRNLQMFTQISRAKIPAGQFASMPSKYFARMVQTVLFKLRRMVPCALCDMQFKVALPEQDEIQLSVVGMALGLGEPTRLSKYKRKLVPNSTSKDPVKKTDEADFIFSLDEDQVDVTTISQETMTNQQTNTNTSNSSPLTGLLAQKHRPRSPFRTRLHMQHRHKHVPLKERYGVDITPLSYLPGGKIERYLGNLNFFFIRESTSIRENGGLSGFTHSFVTEILAIVRAHITALGGNAMVAFFMTQCVLLHSPHKNQGQCLINVGGDVVTVSYYGDEKYQANQNC